METNREKQQERLEKVFAVVDQIKTDLGRAWGIRVNDSKKGMEIAGGKKITWWQFDGVHLFREREVIGLPVTDFSVTYFPESNSVLYRIELDGKEQIRGYIFLMNMKKEG